MKPNLFSIATKELSQDGFFTWLLQWADPINKAHNPSLHETGQDFVRLLLGKKDDFEVKKVEAGRQWGNIDIWAEVNYEIMIIIEDKTHTGVHSDQLKRYKKFAQNWCNENKYKQLVRIYLKTGHECKASLKRIAEDEEYKIIVREDLLPLLDKTIENDIYIDFVEKLKSIEISTGKYETESVKDWEDGSWIGFYKYLENELNVDGWCYIANPAGGFWGMWWHFLDWDDCRVYLQIEGGKHQGKLCFKIGIPDKEKHRGEIRNRWHSIIIEQAKSEGRFEIRKPDRFGSGKFMTVAEIKREDWLGADSDTINKEDIVKRLKEYEEFLGRCVKATGK